MIASYIHSFRSEWLKRKRSTAAWLTLVGGFLIPAIVLLIRFKDFDKLAAANASAQVWDKLYHLSWQFMGIFLLPMGVILATSLVTQLEFRNNAWKQVHATPQTYTTVFFAKLGVILLMLVQFFVLFNIGIYLTGVIPAVFDGVPYPKQPLGLSYLLMQNTKYFVGCLPIVALQYLLSLQFKNFLVPIGVGLCFFVAALVAVQWRYGYTIPYTYCAYGFIGSRTGSGVNLQAWAIGYFFLFIILAYILYINRREKG